MKFNDYKNKILNIFFSKILDECEEYEEYPLEELLIYEQPTKYIVETENYSNSFSIPVLTAGKTFILGYTNEENGIFNASKEKPVIIFDDFTTSTQYVDFRFKVKSSAMKILHINEIVNPKFIYYLMQTIKFDNSTHKRYWISEYSKIFVKIPSRNVQDESIAKLEILIKELDNISNLYESINNNISLLKRKLIDENLYNDKYEICKINDVICKIDNIKLSVEKKDNKYYYIDLSSVERLKNEIKNPSLLYVDELPSRAKQIIKTNDILFGTTRPLLKRVCIIPKIYDSQLCSTGFCVLRPNEKVLPKWLYYNICSNRFYDYIEPLQRGASYPAVSDKEVKKFEICCPPPEEQRKIIQHIEKYMEVIDNMQEI